MVQKQKQKHHIKWVRFMKKGFRDGLEGYIGYSIPANNCVAIY